MTLLRGAAAAVNLGLDVLAAAALVFSWLAAAQNVDAKFPLLLAAPYARTVGLWAAAYLGVDWAALWRGGRRFLWPLKPVFFLALWGWHELVWNGVYFADRWPLTLANWGYVGTFQWYRYAGVLGAAASIAALALVWSGKVRVAKKWLAALLVFELFYALAGVPIEADVVMNAMLPQNWGWEVGYNAVVLPLYLLAFRERPAGRIK